MIFIFKTTKIAKRNQRRYREIERRPFLMDFRTILFKYSCYPKCSTASMESLSKFQKLILAEIVKNTLEFTWNQTNKKDPEETRQSRNKRQRLPFFWLKNILQSKCNQVGEILAWIQIREQKRMPHRNPCTYTKWFSTRTPRLHHREKSVRSINRARKTEYLHAKEWCWNLSCIKQ